MVVLVDLDERGARPRNFHESSELIAGRPRDRLVSCDWCLFPRQLQSGGSGGKYYASELPRLLSGSSVIHVKLGCPLLKLYFHRAGYLNRHMHLPGLAIQNSTTYGVYISWSSAASRSRRASYAGAGLATLSTFVHFRYFCITERITECRRKETIRR